MGFKNVNKMTIEDTDDGREAMSGVVLLMASLVFDDVKAGNYEKALGQLAGLKCSVTALENILTINK